MDNIEQQGWRNLFRTDRAKIDTDMGSLTFSFYDSLEMLSTRRKPLSALDIAKLQPVTRQISGTGPFVFNSRNLLQANKSVCKIKLPANSIAIDSI